MATTGIDASAGFRAGPIAVEPGRNRLTSASGEVSIEPKMMDVLVELAAHEGEVCSRAALIDSVWGLDFGGDESLSRTVSGLRRAFETLAPDETIIETIPKRGYRLTAPVAPLPEEKAPVEGDARRPVPARAVFAALAAAAALLAIFAYTALRPGAAPPLQYDRIAVAEISPLPGDAASAQAAAALREGLLRELALGRVETVAGDNAEGAGLRLAGAFAPPGEASAVNIRVEDAASGEVLWSRQFDLADDAQRRIRHQIPWHVAGTVSCGVADTDLVEPLRDPVIAGYFIRGCDGWRTGGGFAASLEHMRQALAYAPDSLIARLKHAVAAVWTARFARSETERETLIAAARETAGAIADEYPDLGRPYYVLGVADWFELNWTGAEANLRRALSLEPDYLYTYNALSEVLRRKGRTLEAFDLKQRALAADRFSPGQRIFYAFLLSDMGRLDEAYAVADELALVHEGAGCITRHQIDFWRGDARAALAGLDKGCPGDPLTAERLACHKAFLKARLGEMAPRAAFEPCSGLRQSYWVAAALGLVDEAVEHSLSAERITDNMLVLSHPELEPLWRDPRVMQVAAYYGVAQSWVRTGRWPDFCAEPDLPYDCRQAGAAAVRELQEDAASSAG